MLFRSGWILVFKSPAPDIEPDILNIKIQPTEGVYLQFNIKKPGESVDVIQAKMDFCQSCSSVNQTNTPEAYERLIAACIKGERSWFSKWDQIEASWKYVDAIRDKYRLGGVPIHVYKPGSDGPDAAEQLLNSYGHSWFD